MGDRWYNSELAHWAGIALLCLGVGSCTYLCDYPRFPKLDYPQIQKADLNGNSKTEEFYSVDGKTAVTEVDGEPILDFLRKKK